MSQGRVAAIVVLMALGIVSADEIVIEPRTLHLGRPGQFEWEAFKDRKVDAERLELRFEAKTSATEQTLRIWQRDVKLAWPVLLNGRRLGTLTTAETPQEAVFTVPPAALKAGENVLTIQAPSGLDDIEAGPVILDSRPPGEVVGGALLQVTVTDADGDGALPCRITLTRKDGTLQPLRAEPAGEVVARTGVVYTRDGRASIHVPPGDYVLHAGRGFEWGVTRTELSLRSGDVKETRLKLTREVDTRGWIAADSHIHTLTHSGHGDAKIEERMLTIAGEGIELAISTDHNHHTDYAPVAASMGVAERFTPVIGNEVTTKHGHFNAFPVGAGAKVVDFNEQDWAKLIPAIRATPGVQVITLNHPRDLHSGFVPLGGVQFNPATGKHRQADALKIDAMEVVTSAAMQSDIHLLFRDWFALLNRGHRITAVASSDSHDVNRFILGQGRTYVAAKDQNPAQLDLDEVWRSYHEGRLLVSLGLLTTMKVNGRSGVGDTAYGLGNGMEVEITVSGPSWVKTDRLELFANGILIREQALADPGRAGEKARVMWKVPKPAHDIHLVAIATGPGVTEAFWEIPRPYQPSSKLFTPRVIGATNPIWVDADDNGRFDSAFAIAQALVGRLGHDPARLRAALAAHDSAVGVQVESITGKGPQE
ncbi:MAG: PHP domain-containing protein [Prosthecobacter sp.]|jgi:hypothetical protein|uniref:CehA/McbA family metallohydrolase n=1 Tax=Prosthecobacter sp. TaxID=1965333 RepID=UPI0019D8A072|nr:CehA/McbA family metallohydrolase [Prosthecobacter sp.]MBE2285416.1 PHP domain-containing protein [Prosthecobacter sp.]